MITVFVSGRSIDVDCDDADEVEAAKAEIGGEWETNPWSPPDNPYWVRELPDGYQYSVRVNRHRPKGSKRWARPPR